MAKGKRGATAQAWPTAKQAHGQAAIEYMAALIIVLFVFILVQGIAIVGRNNATEERSSVFARQLAQEVANAIFIVSGAQGTRLTVLVPAGLGEQGLPFTLFVSNETVSVDWKSSNLAKSASAPVRVPAVRNATGATRFNITSSGYYFFNNTNGEVWVTKGFN